MLHLSWHTLDLESLLSHYEIPMTDSPATNSTPLIAKDLVVSAARNRNENIAIPEFTPQRSNSSLVRIQL